MKNFLNGFSLAEALVALGIIGIVSAITLPQIATNAQARKNAAMLSKSLYLTEHACQEVIQEHNVNNNNFSNITVIAPIVNYRDSIVQKLTGNNQAAAINTEYTFSQGEHQFMFTSFPAIADQYRESATVFTIRLDANGFEKGPNITGRDQLLFDMHNNCKLTPNDNQTMDFVRRGFKAEH